MSTYLVDLSLRDARPAQQTVFNKFANHAVFLPPLDSGMINKGQESLKQYASSKQRVWQGALPKSFRNYYLELRNDQKNMYRSERITKLVDQKLQFKVENFLDQVVKQSKSNEDEKKVLLDQLSKLEGSKLDRTTMIDQYKTQSIGLSNGKKRVNRFQYSFNKLSDQIDINTSQRSLKGYLSDHSKKEGLSRSQSPAQHQSSAISYRIESKTEDTYEQFLVNKYILARRLKVGKRKGKLRQQSSRF